MTYYTCSFSLKTHAEREFDVLLGYQSSNSLVNVVMDYDDTLSYDIDSPCHYRPLIPPGYEDKTNLLPVRLYHADSIDEDFIVVLNKVSRMFELVWPDNFDFIMLVMLGPTIDGKVELGDWPPNDNIYTEAILFP